MMKNMKDCGEDFRRPVRFSKVDVNADTIAKDLTEAFAAKGIPAQVVAESIKSGGFFGSVYPCITIEHPAPPKSYFEHIIIINGDTVFFKYYGLSQETFNRNKKQALEREGKLIKSALVRYDPMALSTEYSWHDDVTAMIEAYMGIE